MSKSPLSNTVIRIEESARIALTTNDHYPSASQQITTSEKGKRIALVVSVLIFICG